MASGSSKDTSILHCWARSDNFRCEEGGFLVLASDGLWESLTNEEVVGLVGKWLEETGDSFDGG